MNRTFVGLSTLVFLAACAQTPQPNLQPASVSTEYAIEKLVPPNSYLNPSEVDMSDDGRIVLGTVQDGWFLWSAAQGFRKVGPAGSYPLGISGDGSTVIGFRYLSGGTSQAFRWTASGGMQNLGVLPGDLHSNPNDVSFDGSVVVGKSENDNYEVHAFRWTASTGMQNLNASSDQESCATGVSADGKVIAGQSKNASVTSVFRWTTTGGRQSLGSLSGGEYSYLEFGCTYQAITENVQIMSDDGNVIIGVSDSNDGLKAFRWTTTNGMQAIPITPTLLSVSRNGQVVGSGRPAQRWSGAGGLVDLAPEREHPESIVESMSADGTVMVGRTESSSSTSSDFPAFVWTPSKGTQQLSGLGSTTSSPFADVVTSDGNTILGLAADSQENFHIVLWRRQGTSTKQNQTVTFTSTPPSSATVGSTYTVSATASSGLAVSFSSATPNVCTVSDSTVSFVAAGTCTVNASQAGNASYNAAPTVSQNINVTADPATPATATYTIGFDNSPTDRILYSLRVGQGMTGPATSGRISVGGKRIIGGKYRAGNYAKVVDLYGSKRLVVVGSKSGTTPNPGGGRMQFSFDTNGGFGNGSVTVKSITLSNVTANGASINLYQGRTLIRKVNVPVTGAGQSVTLTIDEPGVTILSAFARFPIAVDDLIVSQ